MQPNNSYPNLLSHWFNSSNENFDSSFNAAAKSVSNSLNSCTDRLEAQKIIQETFKGFNFQGVAERKWLVEHLQRSEIDGLLLLWDAIIKYRPEISKFHEANQSLDEFNLISTKTPKNYAPSQSMSYLAQAILQSKKAHGDEIDFEVEQLLDVLTLLILGKATGIDQNAKDMGLQGSTFTVAPGRYHRESGNATLELLTKSFMKDCGLPINDLRNELYLVSTHLISETIERRYPYRCEAPHKIKNYQEFEEYMNQLVKNPTYKVQLIDISSLCENENFNKNEFEKIKSTLCNIMKRSLANSTITSHESFYNDIVFLNYTKYKEQNLLLTFVSDDANKYNSGNKMVGNFIKGISVGGGYVISPDQAKSALIKVETLENILENKEISSVSLNTAGTKFPEDVFKDFNDFLNSKAFKEFSALSEAPNAPPYLKVIPKTVASLIEGFKNQNIDQVFKDKKINDLLQVSYFILKNAMSDIALRNFHAILKDDNGDTVLLRKDDFLSFTNNIELIHQIIQCILVVVNPYDAKAFETAVTNKLISGDHPVIPKELGLPKVHLKPSAMGAFSSILGAIENQKTNKKIKVAAMSESYHEILQNLEKSKSYDYSLIHETSYKKLGDSVFDPQKFKGDKIPIDLFFCEFRHNINFNKNYVFEKSNVKDYIKSIFKNGIAADQLTVVIDNTIDLEVSDELRDLLADSTIKELIQKGRLNLVCMRSAQKYDMLGIDNYYGGIVISINNPDAFSSFNERMDHKDDQLTGISYQGLTHLQMHSKSGLDEYRKAIMSNTQLLYKQIPLSMLESEGKPKMISITQQNDPSTTFLRINIENSKVARAFVKALDAYVKNENLLFTSRESFGFMNMNKALVNTNRCIRLSPGLESPEDIQKYANFFKKIQEILESMPPNSKSADIADKIEEAFLNDGGKKRVIRNVQSLYGKIPAYLTESDYKNKEIYKVRPVGNFSNPFVQMNFADPKITTAFVKAVNSYAQKQNLALSWYSNSEVSSRENFSFENMSLSIAEDEKSIKFFPGLESPENIEKYGKFFDLILETFKNLPANYDNQYLADRIHEIFNLNL